MKTRHYLVTVLLLLAAASLVIAQKRSGSRHAMKQVKPNSAGGQVRLITLDPGHFHAALVQKTMFEQVSPTVYVYGPAGQDLDAHLKLVEGFNTRAEQPTHWEEKVYTEGDFLQKMLADKPGNVVVLAGNNRRKTEYIKASLDAGLNVLADKPMCIDEKGFALLQEAFKSAERNNVLLYDIMTERYEITTMLQKALSGVPAVFGKLQKGTPEDPAITKESVHHFYKTVAGKPLVRPGWFYDTTQQGEGIVDVTTHLVDLVQWEAFPEQKLALGDVKMLRARRWPTLVTREQFGRSTGLREFPDFLRQGLNENGSLAVYSNGEMIYQLRGVNIKVSVIWNFEAPAGAGDTHFSVMKGTKAYVVIRQGQEQNYKPELYVEAAPKSDPKALGAALEKVVADLQAAFPGVGLRAQGDKWQITIPEKYRDGHEAHFGRVAAKYLGFLKDGRLPEWEAPNILTKYYTTTQALKMAK